jgi:hypothetical protein
MTRAVALAALLISLSPALSAAIVPSGEKIYVFGRIEKGDEEVFSKIVSPQTKTIVLDSGGATSLLHSPSRAWCARRGLQRLFARARSVPLLAR